MWVRWVARGESARGLDDGRRTVAVVGAFAGDPLAGDASELVARGGPDAAAVVIEGTVARVAWVGQARVGVQRGSGLEELEPGVVAAAPGDVFVASGAPLEPGSDVIGRGATLARAVVGAWGDLGVFEVGPGARNPSLADRIADLPAPVAVVACGFVDALEAAQHPVDPLRADVLAAAVAVSDGTAFDAVARWVDTASDYDAVPEAAREIHGVKFLAGGVGRHGDGLAAVLARHGGSLPFVRIVLAGLDRVGATTHAALVREGLARLVHHAPALAPTVAALGLPEAPASDTWDLPARWADAPDLARIGGWYVRHAVAHLAIDGVPDGPPPSAPERVATHPTRAILSARLAVLAGAPVTDDTPLADLPVEAVETVARTAGIDPVREGTVTTLWNAVYDTGDPWAVVDA